MGVQIFRTDEQGSIIAYSDGEEITWNCSPSETWKAGEPMGSAESAGGSESKTSSEMLSASTETEQDNYVIGNKNSKAFHRPTCSRLPKEENRVKINTREEALAAGYDNPCNYCNP